MISVLEALNSMDTAGRGLREDEARLDRIVQAATAETARLRAEEADLFRSLARIRLDSLRQNAVIGPLDEAERRALAALKAQQEKLETVLARRQALAAELAGAGAVRDEKARLLAQAADAITERREATERRMADDLAWQAQAAKVSGAEAQAGAAEAKALQAETDRDEKSKPYLSDRLFTYLWERGYGTPAYRGGPIARLGDGYVARTVNYEAARRNYFTLTEIPKRLREHAERLKAALAEEEARLTKLEREALEADGVAVLEAAHRGAEAALKEAEQVIADLKAEDGALEGEIAALQGDGGPWGMGGVLGDLATSLQREDLRSLLREALDTPTPEDERIVRRLQDVEDELAKQARAADEARQAIVELARKKAEIERSRDEVRRYERGGGGFANDKLVGDVIGGIIGGVLSSRELRDALRSGYRPGRGSSAPSRPGGGMFGGGPRGGGGSSGSGGGGFRTGGGF